jgi:hypothetical protein
MFEQASRLAEKLAAGVSRRGFLGSLGGWAAAAAMGVAGGSDRHPNGARDRPRQFCLLFLRRTFRVWRRYSRTPLQTVPFGS